MFIVISSSTSIITHPALCIQPTHPLLVDAFRRIRQLSTHVEAVAAGWLAGDSTVKVIQLRDVCGTLPVHGSNGKGVSKAIHVYRH